MNPNQQQGYYQPDQNQPVQPIAPAPPQAPVRPAVQQQYVQPTPIVDPAALQAALAEPSRVPSPSPQQPAPATQRPTVAQQPPIEQPALDQQDDDQQYDNEPVTWTANEFIHQEKGAMWFLLFGVVVLALLGLSVWTQAWSFTVLIAVIAFVVVIYSRRPPRELTYSITDEGLMVDDKLHEFSNFKSFGIIRDGEEFSVMLIPTQRFQPGVTVYFPEEAGEDIVDMLGSRLPMKDLKLDMVDRAVRLLRL